MGYRYQNFCVDTYEEVLDLAAASCPLLTSDGTHTISCTPSSGSISLVLNTIPPNTPITGLLTPSQIACETAPKLAEIAELSWAVGLLWVTAWGVRKVYEVIRGR